MVPCQGPIRQSICYDCQQPHPPTSLQEQDDTHCIAAYNAIMTHFVAQGLLVDLKILDNKASAAYKRAITFTWQAKFQLVPPDMHHRTVLNMPLRPSKVTSLQSWPV
jgi:hypothetical protein